MHRARVPVTIPMQRTTMQTRHLTIAVAIALSAATSAHAATAADTGASTDAALSAQTLDTVSVIGQGETRQVQRIATVDKQVLPPGTSGQKILDRLPGVSVQSTMPSAPTKNRRPSACAASTRAASAIRWTASVGDNSYGNYNGLSIARAIIAENLAGAELSQGIGSLGVASTSGGTIQYFSMDPSTEFGGRASVTVGDNNQRRGYLRVDTGDLNGFSAYVSGVHQGTCGPRRTRTRPPASSTPRPCGMSATTVSVRSWRPRAPARPTTPTCPGHAGPRPGL